MHLFFVDDDCWHCRGISLVDLFFGQQAHIGINGWDVWRLACDMCAGDGTRDLFLGGGGATRHGRFAGAQAGLSFKLVEGGEKVEIGLRNALRLAWCIRRQCHEQGAYGSGFDGSVCAYDGIFSKDGVQTFPELGAAGLIG